MATDEKCEKLPRELQNRKPIRCYFQYVRSTYVYKSVHCVLSNIKSITCLMLIFSLNPIIGHNVHFYIKLIYSIIRN